MHVLYHMDVLHNSQWYLAAAHHRLLSSGRQSQHWYRQMHWLGTCLINHTQFAKGMIMIKLFSFSGHYGQSSRPHGSSRAQICGSDVQETVSSSKLHTYMHVNDAIRMYKYADCELHTMGYTIDVTRCAGCKLTLTIACILKVTNTCMTRLFIR